MAINVHISLGKTGDFFFGVEEVIDSNTFSAMVGVSTFAHTYVSGGEVTNAAPVILKLSAGRFDEQLPMTLGKNFCIAGALVPGTWSYWYIWCTALWQSFNGRCDIQNFQLLS